MIRIETERPRFSAIRTESITTTIYLNFRIAPERTEEFDGLVSSIRKHGLLQPLLVRELVPSSRAEGFSSGPKYQMISGHRRFLACKRLQMVFVPCIVMALSDQEAFEVALVENVQHQTLSAIEEAEAFKSYVTNFGRGSVTRLASKIGKSEEYVSHRLLLLGLPKVLEDRISRRLLNPSHATELVWLKNENLQIDLSNEIVKHHLSLREVRAIVKMVRDKGMDVSIAVQQVLRAREPESNRLLSCSSKVENRELLDPWQTYNSDDESSENEVIDHAILVVRTCLAGFDLMVNKANKSPLPDIIVKERRNVHTILDELIRYETGFRRRRNVGPARLPQIESEIAE